MRITGGVRRRRRKLADNKTESGEGHPELLRVQWDVR